ncbi:S8/S53 family peptidase [Schaalia odontolytica]|uniref:S8 family peptidase n=2 Tax=Schaalia odontolytica TaxID=1660 RepID=UPI0021097318|nr:S8/S53 family peptidase [Schaalia odontolytica]MCQ5272280.1 S8/S53 family peptidase [Schaalia odontolytica]MCQ5281359.1 S8/S53 family peptidase [Schaalia odontolytica]
MGSPPMVTSKYKVSRVPLAVACASACALGLAVVPAAPARAADTITAADQPYFAYYHLDQARAKGYTGEGVTVAMIDGPVDVESPELSSARITDKSPCTVNASVESKSHGTAVASVLVADGYGVAPKISLLTYTNVDKTSVPGNDCMTAGGLDLTSNASLINHAINDGASLIVNTTGSLDHGNALKWAVARAVSQGVIITDAIGNEARDETRTGLSYWSGVVGVSAVDTNGARTSYSSWGQGVTVAAVGGPVTMRQYPSTSLVQTNGTSISAPIVAGFLAMARQKWPDATSNQLLQLLVHTTVNPDGGWNQYTGYGVASPATMMNTDPSQYPDVNPLADKGGGSSPTPEEIAQYVDGVVPPAEIVFDNSYTYRGLDESVLGATTNPYPTHLGTSPRYHVK